MDKICKNCKFWGEAPISGYIGSKLNARCKKSKRGGSALMRSACGLITNENFGCILFEQKENERI